jgi:hypothetical protein
MPTTQRKLKANTVYYQIEAPVNDRGVSTYFFFWFDPGFHTGARNRGQIFRGNLEQEIESLKAQKKKVVEVKGW